MPSIYNELEDIRSKLELHYKDMQDIEFTIKIIVYGCCKLDQEKEMVLQQ